MKIRKRLLFATFSAFLLSAPYLRADEAGVAVIDKQGARHELSYGSLDRVNFTADGVQLVAKSGESTLTEYKDFDRLLIGASVSAVENLVTDADFAVWPTVTSGTLYVKSASAADVNVYALSGAKEFTVHVAAEQTSSINLSSLPAGVYVLTAGDNSVKIVKK